MLEYFIYSYGNQILMVILCAIFGTVGHALRKIAREQFTDETKRAVAKTVARFVEQVWKELHGRDKLNKALEKAEELLKKKGIPFDSGEMMVLIEAAVAEMNEAFKKPIAQPDTAKAVYRVDCENENSKTDDIVVSGFYKI